MDEFLNDFGIKDYDDLNPVEREEYHKILDVIQTSEVTLEDWKKYVKTIRESVQLSLIEEPEYIYSEILPFLKRRNPRKLHLEARLKNYLLFESFFNKPDKAKEMLEMYKKRKGR